MGRPARQARSVGGPSTWRPLINIDAAFHFAPRAQLPSSAASPLINIAAAFAVALRRRMTSSKGARQFLWNTTKPIAIRSSRPCWPTIVQGYLEMEPQRPQRQGLPGLVGRPSSTTLSRSSHDVHSDEDLRPCPPKACPHSPQEDPMSQAPLSSTRHTIHGRHTHPPLPFKALRRRLGGTS